MLEEFEMKLHLALAAVAVALLVSPAPSFAAAANVPAFVRAAVADPHRPKADTDRDADRLPLAMLGFSGIKPGDTVAELIPAQGYSTRLLSAAVGPKGHVYTINIATLAQGIKDATKPLLADPNYSNVSYTEQNLSNLKVPEYVDAVWTSQNYHDLKNPGGFSADTVAMDKAIFAALKPGGLYLIIDHVAEAGSGTRDTGTLHRIDPATVKAEVLAAGFQFVGESKALANPEPHTARVPGPGNLNDKSDKFYFKFRKPR
jgi:predicted methyltransferase